MKIQTAKDPNNLTELEQKHVPMIEVDENKGTLTVKVKVGEVKHVMTNEHYIEWIKLYIDGSFIKKKDLTLGDGPEVEFQIQSPGVVILRVLESCNLHGVWENKRDVGWKEEL